MDFGKLLAEKALKKGVPTTIFIPETLAELMNELQSINHAKNGNHLSKEKLIYLLAIHGFEGLKKFLNN